MMNLLLLNEDLGMTDRMKENLQLTDEEVISAITSYLNDLRFEKDRSVHKSFRRRVFKDSGRTSTNGCKRCDDCICFHFTVHSFG